MSAGFKGGWRRRTIWSKPVWRWNHQLRCWVNNDVSVACRVINGAAIYWTLPDW